MENFGLIGAWLSLCGGVFGLFVIMEKTANHSFRKTTSEILQLDFRPMICQLPESFINVFDGIFDTKKYSITFFFRSYIASIVCVIINSLVYLMLFRKPESGFNVWVLFMMGYNLIADCISLIEIRYILSLLKKTKKSILLPLILIADLIITFLVFCIVIIVMSSVGTVSASIVSYLLHGGGTISWNIHTFIIDGLLLKPNPEYLSAGIYLYSTFFTSVWIWIYILAAVSIKVISPFLGGLYNLNHYLDTNNKPFLCMGVVSVGIVTVLYWGIVVVNKVFL